MIHYHGTPINPKRVFYALAGRNFCVSFFCPDQLALAHKHGQSVLLDNGAFSVFTELRKDVERRRAAGESVDPDEIRRPIDWQKYYRWVDPWLDYPTTWAIIPDVIDAGAQEQDALLKEWPFGDRGAPVWHMDEPVDRLLRLLDEWPRVCIGSTGEFWLVNGPEWSARMDEVWNEISKRHSRTPWVHMLRGMQLSTGRWPFASVDSTDLARNHNRLNVLGGDLVESEGLKAQAVRRKADRWDMAQTPGRWTARPVAEQLKLRLA